MPIIGNKVVRAAAPQPAPDAPPPPPPVAHPAPPPAAVVVAAPADVVAPAKPAAAAKPKPAAAHPFARNIAEITAQRKVLEPVLVQAGTTWDAWLAAATILLLKDSRKLRSCTFESVTHALIECARDGLLPDGKQAYLVPRGGECCYQPTAPAVIKALSRDGALKHVDVSAVYANDTFKVVKQPKLKIIHELAPPNDRGAFVAIYAVARFKGQKRSHIEVMSVQDIMPIARDSKSKAWSTDYFGETAKKSVIRRLLKYAPTENVGAQAMRVAHRFDEMFEGAWDDRDTVAAPAIAAASKALPAPDDMPVEALPPDPPPDDPITAKLDALNAAHGGPQ